MIGETSDIQLLILPLYVNNRMALPPSIITFTPHGEKDHATQPHELFEIIYVKGGIILSESVESFVAGLF